jgi:hypothetical protein
MTMITNSSSVPAIRTSGPVGAGWIEIGANGGQQSLIEHPCREPVSILVRGEVGIIATGSGADLIIFVIPAPERQTRMMPQATHLRFGFGAHTIAEPARSGIDAAGEHEILPHQQPQLVTGIVERIVLMGIL